MLINNMIGENTKSAREAKIISNMRLPRFIRCSLKDSTSFTLNRFRIRSVLVFFYLPGEIS